MILLGLFAAFSTLLLFGAGIAGLLLARNRSINLVEWACLSWLLGVAGVSISLWLLGGVVSGLILQGLVTTVAMGFGFAGWRAFRRGGARLTIPRPDHWIEYVLLAIVLTQVATIFYACGKHTLGWDGLLVWELKAHFAFLSDGVLPASYFADEGRAFSHPDYPLAIPFTELWLYLWMGEPNQFWAKTIFPAFYLAGAGLLSLLGRRLTGRRWMGYALAACLYFVPQVSVATGSVLVGYADFPLGVFYLATVGYLLCSLTRTPGPSFSIFATCLAFLPWLKKEGAILWVVAAFAGVVVVWMRHKPRLALVTLLPGFGVLLSWRIFLRIVHATPTVDVLPLTLETLRSNISRVPSIFHVVLVEATTINHWGIFWAVAAVAALYLVWRCRELPCSLLLWTTLVPILLYSLTYVFSAWHVYLDHVSSSMSRLMMQVVPTLWLAVGVAISEWTSKRPARGPLFEGASPALARPSAAGSPASILA